MYGSIHDFATLVGFSQPQQEHLRRALGEGNQHLYDQAMPVTLREVVWLSKIVWPDLAKVVEADVEMLILEGVMTHDHAAAWGNETHRAMALLIQRMATVAERHVRHLPMVNEAGERLPPPRAMQEGDNLIVLPIRRH